MELLRRAHLGAKSEPLPTLFSYLHPLCGAVKVAAFHTARTFSSHTFDFDASFTCHTALRSAGVSCLEPTLATMFRNR